MLYCIKAFLQLQPSQTAVINLPTTLRVNICWYLSTVKIKLYKTLIRPVLAYGSETRVLSKSDEAILVVFERKILRAIFGPINDNGEWRIKQNNELYTLYKESDIVTYINRLKLAGHVIGMEEQNPTRRVLVAVVEGRRQRGRPKLR